MMVMMMIMMMMMKNKIVTAVSVYGSIDKASRYKTHRGSSTQMKSIYHISYKANASHYSNHRVCQPVYNQYTISRWVFPQPTIWCVLYNQSQWYNTTTTKVNIHSLLPTICEFQYIWHFNKDEYITRYKWNHNRHPKITIPLFKCTLDYQHHIDPTRSHMSHNISNQKLYHIYPPHGHNTLRYPNS